MWLGENGVIALEPVSSNLTFATVRSKVNIVASQLSVTSEIINYALWILYASVVTASQPRGPKHALIRGTTQSDMALVFTKCQPPQGDQTWPKCESRL